jgi:uncharacterized protein YdhG (YjbR/CyaY superfamily)
VSAVTQNTAKASLTQDEQGRGPLTFILGYRLERPQRELVWYDGATALHSISRRLSCAEHRKGESSMAVDDKKATMNPAKASKGFTDEERAAIRERAQEQKVRKADGESDVLAKIAALPAPDRALAERLHAIIKASAPALTPKTWYGMPAYAKNSKIVCFFQPAHKFKTRYATLGFNDVAHLDDGALWPVAYALKELTAADEARIAALVKQAAS